MDFIRFDEDEAYAYGFMGFNELSQSVLKPHESHQFPLEFIGFES